MVMLFLDSSYGLIRDGGIETAGVIMESVSGLPIRIINTVTRAVFRDAARFKVNCSMSLADTFLCATAKSLSATIVTRYREILAAERLEGLIEGEVAATQVADP
jgi:hypothetical protein